MPARNIPTLELVEAESLTPDQLKALRYNLNVAKTEENMRKALEQSELASAVDNALTYRGDDFFESVRMGRVPSSYFEAALEVLGARMRYGDLRAATFVAGRYMDDQRDKMPGDMIAQHQTYSEAAEAVVEAVVSGQVSVDTGQSVLALIQSAAGITDGQRLDDLMEKLESIERSAQGEADPTHTPTWMRLKNIAPTPQGDQQPVSRREALRRRKGALPTGGGSD